MRGRALLSKVKVRVSSFPHREAAIVNSDSPKTKIWGLCFQGTLEKGIALCQGHKLARQLMLRKTQRNYFAFWIQWKIRVKDCLDFHNQMYFPITTHQIFPHKINIKMLLLPQSKKQLTDSLSKILMPMKSRIQNLIWFYLKVI